MPQDASTRWNSTNDMLQFSLKYQAAVDNMTGNRDMNLREYELNEEE